jgi:hypothetical protein
MFEFKIETFRYFTFSLFICRIVFACLVVCRWQVRHGMSDEDRGRSRTPGAEDRG